MTSSRLPATMVVVCSYAVSYVNMFPVFQILCASIVCKCCDCSKPQPQLPPACARPQMSTNQSLARTVAVSATLIQHASRVPHVVNIRLPYGAWWKFIVLQCAHGDKFNITFGAALG
jgi:hypothetical protein